MKDALLEREDCNVIVVYWSRGATPPYFQAAGNTRLVGAQTAELIRFVISSNNGSSLWADRFYIVGFSLGAQIAGYAGTDLKAHGMVLGRITGTVTFLGISYLNSSRTLQMKVAWRNVLDIVRESAESKSRSHGVSHTHNNIFTFFYIIFFNPHQKKIV